MQASLCFPPAATNTASKVAFPAMDPLYADPLNTVNVTVLDRPNARAAGGCTGRSPASRS